jgi:hypothetical protein
MVRRVAHLLPLALLACAGGDGKDEVDGDRAADADTDTDADADADADADTDSEPPHSGTPPVPLSAPEGVFGVPNVDVPGYREADPTDDEVVTIEIVPGTGAAELELELVVDPAELPVRIWREGAVLLDSAATTLATVTPADPEAPLALGVELGWFGARGTLRLRTRDAAGSDLEVAEVGLYGAPLLLNHHLQPAERVYAVDVSSAFMDNAAFVAAFADALGPAFQAVNGRPYGDDVWIQDEVELATCTAPLAGGGVDRLDVAIDSVRDRGLDRFPESELRDDEFASLQFSQVRANTYDSFGNLETSPPIAGFPTGMTYFGDAGGGAGPRDATLYAVLDAQGVQGGLRVDTSWLCVGHVDEYASTIPDPTAPRGFRLVWSDPEVAWDVLDALDPSTALPRWAGWRNHGYETVGELVADQGLRDLNAEVRAERLEPLLDQLRAEWAITDDEVVRIPALFEEAVGCGGRVAALIPGMANLAVVELPGEPVRVFTADPFLRSDLADQTSDPVIQRMRELFPPTIELWFVDDWETYHLGLGEVHCGTNVIRSPTYEWWTGLPGGAP